jgi:hypothetical protein
MWAETTSKSPNRSLTTQVACMAKQGTGGCGVEQQLEAAVMGIKNTPDFIADTHLLAVLVVSDEEDCSIESNGLFQTDEWLMGSAAGTLINVACNYPVENEQYLFAPESYYTRFVALKKNKPKAVIFAAIVGVPYDDSETGYVSPCQGDGVEIAKKGCLADPAMQLEVWDFLDENGDPYKHFRRACTRHDDVSGEEVTGATPGRRYVEVAEKFASNGYVYSICNEDWGPAMSSIARIIARQIVATCYPKQLEWSLDPAPNPDRVGKAKCDVVVEINRTGADLKNEDCLPDLYAGLSPEERKSYEDRRQVIVNKKGGVVSSKTILCPLPKLSTPRDCDLAQGYIRGTQPDDVVGWYYCEKLGENFDDVCNDNGIDNDGDNLADCDDPDCFACEVCGGNGAGCEEGCRYGIEVTDGAKAIVTGHSLSVQCLQRFNFGDQNCQEDTRDACNDDLDNDGNGIWNCNDTLNKGDAEDPHLPDPNCCRPLTKDGSLCSPTAEQIEAIRQICPEDDDGGEWSWQQVGACVARARELGCNLSGSGE